jgi:hypothetical protein
MRVTFWCSASSKERSRDDVLVAKYEFIESKFQRTMEVPLRNTLLETVCSNLGVSHSSVIIVELSGIAPKSLRKEGKDGKAKLEKLLVKLQSTSQSIADNGIKLDGIQYWLLQATSGVKTNASMILSSDMRLVEYFNQLMKHNSKTPNQLRMGYQLALTPNKAVVTHKGMKLLIVDDEFNDYQIHAGSINQFIGVDDAGVPVYEAISAWEDSVIKHFDTRQATAGVGDCHIKISRQLAQYLAGKVVGDKNETFLSDENQGCQFRMMIHEYPAMAKGTFVVSDSVPGGYHMVVAKSSFKLGFPNIPSGVDTFTVSLGSTMPAVAGKAQFGSQFARSMGSEVLAARQKPVEKAMAKLNEAGNSIQSAAKFFNAEANQTIEWTEVDEETGEELTETRDDWFYKAMFSIATSERLNWALKDPTIIKRILDSIAKRKMKLALGMGFIGRVRTALPDDSLPLNVISSVDAPIVSWVDGKWTVDGKVVPDRAVGMVESNGQQYFGLLVVRGKAPIMNHGEQCLAVLVHREDGIGTGCEFMSHQSASLCTMDFDGDRNSVLHYQKESGYLEAINWMVRLQRECPMEQVQKDKSKVDRSWGELTKLVYESAFEMGCSSITSLYCKATADGGIDSIKAWIPTIAETTAATQLWLDVQKVAPKDPEGCKAVIDLAITHYQGWQGDQRDWALDSVPYIHREMVTSKKYDGTTTDDVGIVPQCIRYVNGLHEVPPLLDGMKPLTHLRGIWGDYTASDKETAIQFKASLRAFDALCKEGDADSKKVSALIDEARVRCQEFTNAQFSAFWDLSYNKDCLIEMGKDKKEYIPTANKPWMLFTSRILENTPELLLKKETVLFKHGGKTPSPHAIDAVIRDALLDKLTKESFKTVCGVSPEFVVFHEKNKTLEMFPVISVKRGTVIGYVGTHVVPDMYEVELSAIRKQKIHKSTGLTYMEVYECGFMMRIIDIDF